MQNTRLERVAQHIQQEVAMIIHQELKDPRLGFVTITRLELSKDLRYAKVSFSCLGGAEERTRCQEALDHSARFVHGLLKKRLRLKVIPEILFRYDVSIEEAIAMSETLDRLAPSPSKDTQRGAEHRERASEA
jgi:ribosome-binding factor A